MSSAEEWREAYKRDPNATFEHLLELAKPPLGAMVVTPRELIEASCSREGAPCAAHRDTVEGMIDRIRKNRAAE